MEFLILILLIGLVFAYRQSVRKGMAPRVFKTRLPQQRLRALFESRVARAGWKIVNESDPIVAQAGVIVGAQQQIALHFGENDDDDMTYAMVGPHTWIEGAFMPKKSHTIRMRLNSFMNAVQAEDPGVMVIRDVDGLKDATSFPTL